MILGCSEDPGVVCSSLVFSQGPIIHVIDPVVDYVDIIDHIYCASQPSKCFNICFEIVRLEHHYFLDL